MKIDRLIGIITILMQNDKITAPELAERFEVSRRTINRDIEDICKAGIPLVTTQGYGGGISVADGYKIDRSIFTKEELQAVFAGLKGIDSISETQRLPDLIDKLSKRGSRLKADDMIIIDLASHYIGSLTQKINIIKKAISENKTISFEYYYEKGEQKRTIEPYHLVFKWSSWYVLGYCLERKAYRLFKLNRLWDLECTGKNFNIRSIPEEELCFDNFFSRETIHLKAEFYETEKHRLIDEYGVDCYSISLNGKLLFERDFVSYENMREWVFSFGDKVCVLEPDRLKAERFKHAQNILKENL